MKGAGPAPSPRGQAAFRRTNVADAAPWPTLPASAPMQAAPATYNGRMARQESDREDLLREATALVERAELKVAGEPEPVTVGFRRDGSLSVFFGSVAVYQFNTAGELRRAFADGLLYK